MPIQLDKILADIAEERQLHPYNLSAKKKDVEEAWLRVGKKNKLSAHEAKSIFKVLQKKYEQENLKASSTWKLYQQMDEICRKEEETKLKSEPDEIPEAEDESYVEFLEVREEDDEDDGDSDNQAKSMKSNSSTGSPEKDNNADAKPTLLNTQMMIPQTTTTVKPDYTSAATQNQKQVNTAAFTSALQKKGISMRKTGSPALESTTLPDGIKRKLPTQEREPLRSVLLPEGMKRKLLSAEKEKREEQQKHSILLPEGIKRKLGSVEKRDEAGPPKRSYISNSAPLPSVTTSLPVVEIKQEIPDEMDAQTSLATGLSGEPINVITIPPNPTVSTDISNGITTIKTNGYNSQIDLDLDFQKDIIFDNNPISSVKSSNSTGEIINIGNFENQLPPTFFKNLCNSQRHEALGLYVANIMNRVTGKAAAKLELNILKAIIEAQSDELARL